MQDIRKPYSRSRSSIHNISRERDIRSKTEEFEAHSYARNDDMTKRDDRSEFAIPIHAENRTSRDVYPRRPDGLGWKDRDTPPVYTDRSSSRSTTIFFVIAGIIVVGLVLMTYVFDSAKVSLTPKYVDIEGFSKSFSFTTVADDPVSIPYITATTSVTKSKKLPVSESKLVQTKASGKVIIFNNFDGNPQQLIKNTRFESPSGKIYRINESIAIPGKKGDVPGSLEVTVYADSFGPDYNSDPTDFTIPGFKGTPRYEAFFGRSNGPLSGGASGNVSLVSKSDLNSAKDELAIEINKAIRENLKDVSAVGYTPLRGVVKVVYEDNEKDVSIGQSSTYTVTATGYMVLADEKRLASSVASVVRGYGGEDVRLDYIDSLSFVAKDTATIGTDTTTEILIEGVPRVVWLTDFVAIKNILKGKSKSDFTEIMKGVQSIDKATPSFFPIWITKFPADESSIDVKENLKAR
ncbi:MAG: hypothetical protein QG653_458 [Patescibacteria group bacterium]|nr:hypothetical protein [Patescibacteria group bacterium]